MKRLLAAVAGLAIALIGTVAVAAWLSSGAGAATVTATTVLKAYTPSATPDGSSVLLEWDPSTLADGSPVGGYRVVRHQGGDSTDVCVTTATSCHDTHPVGSVVEYGVIATIGSWSGPESDRTSFQYDGQAPVTSIVVDPVATAEGWNNTAVDVFLTAADTSGIDRIVFTIDGVEDSAALDNTWFTVSGTGIHTITWYAVDKVGNVETTQSRTIRIDPDAPVTTVSSSPAANAAGWNNTNVTLGFTAADVSGAGVRSVTVDGITTTGATATKTVSTEGTTSVNYFATDKADNLEATKTATVKIDNTKPTILRTSPLSPVSSSDVTLDLSANDTRSGVAAISVTVGPIGGSGTTTTYPFAGAPANTTKSITVSAEGKWLVTAVSTDVAGNTSDPVSWVVNIDRTPPRATFADPGSMTWKQIASQNIVIGALDDQSSSGYNSGVADLVYTVDGGAEQHLNATGVQFVLGQGDHTVTAYVVDSAGNTGPTVTARYRFDSVVPTGAITFPASNGSYNNQQFQDGCPGTGNDICGTAADVAGSGIVPSGVAKVEFEFRDITSGTTGPCMPATGSTYSTTACNTRRLASGTTSWSSAVALNGNNRNYRLTVWVTDVAGNEFALQSRSFTR